MNARQQEGRPPKRDNARGEAGIIGTTQSTRPQSTAPARGHQGAKHMVLTTKASGAQIVFGIYQTGAEAAAVAARLIEVGGNAHVVEVRHV